MNNSGKTVSMIKDPESEIEMSLNSKLGIGEDTIFRRKGDFSKGQDGR